jgi:hypothetical protein
VFDQPENVKPWGIVRELAQLVRSLGKLSLDIGRSIEAISKDEPNFDAALAWLRAAELRLHECRRTLDRLHYGVNRASEPPKG